jgi:hypothetical protein
MNPYEAPQNVDEESKPRVATASIPHYRAYFCWWCALFLLLELILNGMMVGNGIRFSDALKLLVPAIAITYGLSYAIIRYHVNLLPIMTLGLSVIATIQIFEGLMNRPYCGGENHVLLIKLILDIAKEFIFTNNASNPWNGSIAANGLSWQGAIFVTVLYQFCIFCLQFLLGWCLIGVVLVFKHGVGYSDSSTEPRK